MTGQERICRVLEGKPADRAPVMASFIAAGAEWRGIPQSRLHRDADTLVTTLMELSAGFGLDGAYLSSDNWIIHAALGGAVEFPHDDEPRSRRPVLEDWNRLETLAIPVPERAERMAFMLHVARTAVARNPSRLFLEANIDSGPFQMAGILRGAEQLMLDLVTEPKRVHDLLRFCTQVVCAYGRAMAQTGVDAVQFGDSTATLVSRAMYEEFVEPYQAPVIAAIRESGAYPFLHVCGRSDHLAERLGASRAACVEIDGPADLDRALVAAGRRVTLRGNIPTPLLREGTPDAVFERARDCLRIAAGRPFILSPGCGVPRGTQPDGIRAIVRAATAG